MRTPKAVSSLWLENACSGIGLKQWEEQMNGSVRADKRRINALVRRHLPEMYQDLALNLYNPYRYFKTRSHLILVHSAIEYFLRYEE
jgi:hypothetical protein